MQKSVQKQDTENVLIAVALLALSDAIFKIFRENRRKETDMMDAVKSVALLEILWEMRDVIRVMNICMKP